MLKYSGDGSSSAVVVPDGVAGGAAAIPVAGGLLLGIRLRFHNHSPQQLALGLAFHQQAADELGGNELGGAGSEGWGERWESVVAMGVAWVLGGGYWMRDYSRHQAPSFEDGWWVSSTT